MEIDLKKLLAVVSAFNREGVEYVLIGGAAMNLHGLLRSTEDYDFFVRPDEENVERAKRALRSIWDDQSIDEIRSTDVEEYSTVRYATLDESIIVDLIGRLGEMYEFDGIESQILEFDGVPVRMVTPEMLYKMKKDTIRAKDKMDAEALRRKFKLED
jgi:hypothetical protein